MNYYLFPFDKVAKNSRIVLYGAGRVGQQFYEQITATSFCRVVLWLDKKADEIVTKNPETIKNLNFDDCDIVVIAIKSSIVACDIKELLLNYGIPEDKILHEVSVLKFKTESHTISAKFEYSDKEPLFEEGYFESKGIEIFEKFPNWQQTYRSLANKWQIAFLQGLIADYKFTNNKKIKNVLEIGVFRGVTSLYMLKAGLLHDSDFQLYGIDIGKEESFGEAVFAETNIEEQKHYHLYRGSTSFDIEEVIPKNTKIDMIFIDGGHSHPHPLFDLIHSIPFLHSESVVMLHDVVDYMYPNAWGESFIFTAWDDRKYRTVYGLNGDKTTLGCIKIPDEKLKLYENIRRIAKISFRASPWNYGNNWLGVDYSNLSRLRQFMVKYYDKSFAEEIYAILKKNLDEYEEKWLLYHHETKFFNYLFNENKRLRNEVDALSKKIFFMEKRIELHSKYGQHIL